MTIVECMKIQQMTFTKFPGALAERGLKAVMPSESEFTTRLTSEVLESNGELCNI